MLIMHFNRLDVCMVWGYDGWDCVKGATKKGGVGLGKWDVVGSGCGIVRRGGRWVDWVGWTGGPRMTRDHVGCISNPVNSVKTHISET